LLQRLAKYDLISEVVAKQIERINASQLESAEPLDFPLDGPHITNLELFMKYILAYLRARKDLHHRRLAEVIQTSDPGRDGISIEIFAFTKATGWVEHAATRDEIMIHIIAAAPFFDLRIFQDATRSR